MVYLVGKINGNQRPPVKLVVWGRPLEGANKPGFMRTLKFEYQNPKFETISNDKNSNDRNNIYMTTHVLWSLSFWAWPRIQVFSGFLLPQQWRGLLWLMTLCKYNPAELVPFLGFEHWNIWNSYLFSLSRWKTGYFVLRISDLISIL